MSSRNRTISEDIELYFSFVEERIERLRMRGHEKDDEPLRFLIALSLIDAISGVAYPTEPKRVRDRFTKAVTELGKWSDANRVSLPHLVRFLELLPEDDFLEARATFNSIPKFYEYGRFHGLGHDPHLNSVENLWPIKAYKKCSIKLSLLDMTHASLLYAQRNMLVHEQRDGTLGWDVSGGSKQPYYQALILANKDTIQLVHPIGFVLDLCASVAAGAKHLFIEEQRSPYEFFSEGHFVYRELDYQMELQDRSS